MWKKRYIAALPLVSLDRSRGGNYVIQNAGFPDTDRRVITVLDDGNRLGVDAWHNEFVSDKMFKIEPCSDRAEDCVISTYGSSSKQWFVENGGGTGPATLETKSYPKSTDERLRPPLKQWRFAFEEVNPLGSKKYRIISRDEELEDDGRIYLRIGDAGGR